MGWRRGITWFNSLRSHSDHLWKMEYWGQDGNKKPVLQLEGDCGGGLD